jgi:glycosyltransferase involved in cell wall biosynthesis
MRDLPATGERVGVQTDLPGREIPGSRHGAAEAAAVAAERVRALSPQAESAVLQYREAEAKAASAPRAGVARNAADEAPSIAELHARAVRLNGTLDAARIMLAKLEAEVRWARNRSGLRQLHPAAVLRAARQWANRHVRKIYRSGLFDVGWYLWSNPDVEASGEEPIHHYLRKGWREGRDPGPFFSIAWYLDNHPDVRAAGGEPLSHYIDHGLAEGREPHPLFKGRWYLTQNSDVARSGTNPLYHYISCGAAEGRDPHPWFRTEWYLAQNPDVTRSGLNPLFHYITTGAAAGLDPHPWFKGDWYRAIAARLAPSRAGSASAAALPRPQSPLAPALAQLLRMFHDETTLPVLEECLVALASGQPRVALAETVARLAGRGMPDAPDATVIVRSRDAMQTLCCLYSVLSLRSTRSFEVIVVGDGAATIPAPVARAGGVVRCLVAGSEKDAVTAMARGRTLVFLSGDSIVLPGWLDELLGTLEADHAVGLVCSKCVTRDGALWPAAATADGTSLGGADDACAPQHNYLDDVSDAGDVSVAIARAQWERSGATGGDLAARVRAAGLRAVRQPLSAVVHQGAGRPTVAGEHSRPRILFMDHAVPQPDRDAGSRTTVQYLEMFHRAGFHVTYWPQDLYFDRPYVLALQRAGIEVIYGWNGIWPHFAKWLELNTPTLDYAYLLRPTCAVNFIDQLRNDSRARILFAGVDVHFKRMEMEAEKTGSPQARNEARNMELLEKELWRKSDVVYYLSDSEIALVKATCPDKNAQVINTFIFDPAKLRATRARVKQQGIPGGRQLLFVGGFRHSPNVDAMAWFVAEIWPRILAAVPDARLTIAGSSPPPAIRALASDAITVSGPISDEELVRRYVEATAAIVPLRFGAGVKGKLLEALSYGAPVVTTSVGTQGLAAVEPFVDVADSADAFAGAVIDVLRAPQSQLDKVVGGLDYLAQNLTEAAALAILSREVPELRPHVDRLLADAGLASA